MVQQKDWSYVVKQALPNLRPQTQQSADITRNHYEQEYLNTGAKIVPDPVRAILLPGTEFFVMKFLEDEYSDWNSLLSDGEVEPRRSLSPGWFIMKIQSVSAFQIFDSRGFPTIEAEMVTENGIVGRGLVPSGASTGPLEALKLRDGNAARFRKKSVFQAIANIEGEIAASLRGRDVCDQRALDDILIALDGTADKSRLGANALLGVSMAAASAASQTKGVPLYASLGTGTTLPLPEIQIFGGETHTNWRTDIQNVLLIATGAASYEEALEITFRVFRSVGELMRKKGKLVGSADEGGHWPEFSTNEEAVTTVAEAVEHAGYTLGKEASLSLDIAASNLFDEATGTYRFALENRSFSSDEFMDLLSGWCRDYQVVSIEDPAADTDWNGWKRIYDACGKTVQIVGDDLFTSNLARIREGIARGVANAVLIKLNQVGTVSETVDAIRLTQEAGWAPVISARSGETEDAFISHLSVATNAGQLKAGSFCRSERMVKWNEILRIGRQLGPQAKFLGKGGLAPISNLSLQKRFATDGAFSRPDRSGANRLALGKTRTKEPPPGRPTAIVTAGAGPGIGHGISSALSHHGWDLVLVDRDENASADLADRLRAQGSQVEVISLDGTDPATSGRVVEATLMRFGRIDGLVNNLGIGLTKMIGETSDEEFLHLFNTDFMSAFRFVKAALPSLRQVGGSIVNIGSVHARLGAPKYGLYAATKAAMEAFTRGLAVDYGQEGLRANIVHPGLVESAQNEALLANVVPDPRTWMDEFARNCQCIPRLTTAGEVGELVAFLLGGNSRLITGQSIFIDGGTTSLLWNNQ